jgi:hypothetical protein
VKIDLTTVRGTTRFGDLAPELQNMIEQIDKVWLERQLEPRDRVTAFMPGHEEKITTVPDSVEHVERRLAAVKSTTEMDANTIHGIKNVLASDVNDARAVFAGVDALKMPYGYTQYSAGGGSRWGATGPASNQSKSRGADDGDEAANLLTYFARMADDMNAQLGKYSDNIKTIEQHLRGVESGLYAQSQQAMMMTPGAEGENNAVRQVGAVLTDFEEAIYGVASKVGEIRESVQGVIVQDVEGQRRRFH